MTVIAYIKDKILIILGNLFAMMCLSGYLYLNNMGGDSIVLILAAWFAVLAISLTMGYSKRKKYFDKLEHLAQSLDQKYLLAEVMEPSCRLEDKLYHRYLHLSSKSVIERIHRLEDEQRDYKEYIEGWIHEVKRPITAMELICENNRNDATRKLQMELREIDNDVEQALFFARSEAVYQDYMIREMELKPIILEVLSKNKQLFIQNQMSVRMDCEESRVLGDGKWIAFILNQIMNNAVKYKKNAGGTVCLYTEEVPHGRRLVVEDDGIGIKKNELGRIFDKGFTGSNGRNKEKSTGIGLYLCRKLCDKLGIQIMAESGEGAYTRIILVFPMGDYLSKL